MIFRHPEIMWEEALWKDARIYLRILLRFASSLLPIIVPSVSYFSHKKSLLPSQPVCSLFSSASKNRYLKKKNGVSDTGRDSRGCIFNNRATFRYCQIPIFNNRCLPDLIPTPLFGVCKSFIVDSWEEKCFYRGGEALPGARLCGWSGRLGGIRDLKFGYLVLVILMVSVTDVQ